MTPTWRRTSRFSSSERNIWETRRIEKFQTGWAQRRHYLLCWRAYGRWLHFDHTWWTQRYHEVRDPRFKSILESEHKDQKLTGAWKSKGRIFFVIIRSFSLLTDHFSNLIGSVVLQTWLWGGYHRRHVSRKVRNRRVARGQSVEEELWSDWNDSWWRQQVGRSCWWIQGIPLSQTLMRRGFRTTRESRWTKASSWARHPTTSSIYSRKRELRTDSVDVFDWLVSRKTEGKTRLSAIELLGQFNKYLVLQLIVNGEVLLNSNETINKAFDTSINCKNERKFGKDFNFLRLLFWG